MSGRRGGGMLQLINKRGNRARSLVNALISNVSAEARGRRYGYLSLLNIRNYNIVAGAPRRF